MYIRIVHISNLQFSGYSFVCYFFLLTRPYVHAVLNLLRMCVLLSTFLYNCFVTFMNLNNFSLRYSFSPSTCFFFFLSLFSRFPFCFLQLSVLTPLLISLYSGNLSTVFPLSFPSVIINPFMILLCEHNETTETYRRNNKGVLILLAKSQKQVQAAAGV